MRKKRGRRKKKHEVEKWASSLGAGGRHPEGRYGVTKVLPKAGDHFSNDRCNVAAEGRPIDLLRHVQRKGASEKSCTKILLLSCGPPSMEWGERGEKL